MKGLLKYIEIENFKSFEGKHTIGPFTKFTAIIGPNGSGKSNLMDAISFVLAEKTTNLRVRRINELIHGAQIGRPVATKASVRLIYVEDSTETTFSRSVVGNASEYRINSKVVQPGIYAEKLAKIGILVKSKNFLVFQGTVESIAMKNAKERAEVFEVISGSRELKERYEAAKREMMSANEETQAHYLKKREMATEKRDAEFKKGERERYKTLLDQHESKRTELFLFELHVIGREMEKFDEDLEGKLSVLKGLKSEHDKIKDEIYSKKRNGAKLNRDVEKIDQRLKELELNLQRNNPLLINSKEKTSHSRKKIELAKKNLEAAERQNKTQISSISGLEEALRGIEKARQNWAENLKNESQTFQLEPNDMEEYNKLRKATDDETNTITLEIESLERDQKIDKDSLNSFFDRQKDILARKNQKESEIDDSLTRSKKLAGILLSSELELQQHINKAKALTLDIEAAKNKIQKLNEEIASVDHQLSQATMDQNESQRSKRKEEILTNLRALHPGLHGRVFDLCHPTHKRYQIAVTKVLGSNFEAIVCNSKKTATDCIEYLKERKYECEIFIPLDSIKTRPIDDKLRDLKSDVKLVYDVIRFSPIEVKKAFTFVCGNSLVCDTVDEAKRVAFDLGERHKTVSLDGTLFEKSGIISGGTMDLRIKAKRWEEKDLNKLRNARDALAGDLKDQIMENRKEFELSQIRTQIEGLESRLALARVDQENSENKAKSLSEIDIASLNSQLENLEPVLSELGGKIEKRGAKLEKLQTRKNKIQDRIFSAFCSRLKIENIRLFEQVELAQQKDLAAKSLSFDTHKTRLLNQLQYERSRETIGNITKWTQIIAQEEADLEKLESEAGKMTKSFEGISREIGELGGMKERIKDEINRGDEVLADLKASLTQSEEKIDEMKKLATCVETKCDQKRIERHNLLKVCKMKGISIPLVSGRIEDLAGSSETAADNGDLLSLNVLVTQEARRIYEYEKNVLVDYSSLPENLMSIDLLLFEKERENLEIELSDLALSLDNLANNNLAPSEHLEEFTQRFAQTESEFEQARNRTKRARLEFDSIKKERLARFHSFFDHVSGCIDGVYKELCDDSTSQAILGPENMEEPYLEGISYNCAAPKKRFCSMDSMSGGEKTLAALALLFCMHSYRPSPFFVLDEVDSSLDNTNINKVASYICQQSRVSFQCILISLKEEFYGRADTLIGIYPEMGDVCMRSRTLSLDLTQYDDRTVYEEE